MGRREAVGGGLFRHKNCWAPTRRAIATRQRGVRTSLVPLCGALGGGRAAPCSTAATRLSAPALYTVILTQYGTRDERKDTPIRSQQSIALCRASRVPRPFSCSAWMARCRRFMPRSSGLPAAVDYPVGPGIVQFSRCSVHTSAAAGPYTTLQGFTAPAILFLASLRLV